MNATFHRRTFSHQKKSFPHPKQAPNNHHLSSTNQIQGKSNFRQSNSNNEGFTIVMNAQNQHVNHQNSLQNNNSTPQVKLPYYSSQKQSSSGYRFKRNSHIGNALKRASSVKTQPPLMKISNFQNSYQNHNPLNTQIRPSRGSNFSSNSRVLCNRPSISQQNVNQIIEKVSQVL